MLIAPLFSTALILAVATDPLQDAPGRVNLTTQEKIAATEPLVRSATRCIIRTVIADPRYDGKSGRDTWRFDRQLHADLPHSCPGDD